MSDFAEEEDEDEDEEDGEDDNENEEEAVGEEEIELEIEEERVRYSCLIKLFSFESPMQNFRAHCLCVDHGDAEIVELPDIYSVEMAWAQGACQTEKKASLQTAIGQ